MPGHGRFTVTIFNQESNQTYREYEIKTTGNHTECYVESNPGEKFGVRIEADAAVGYWPTRTESYAAHIIMDGQRVAGKYIGYNLPATRLKNEALGRPSGQNEHQPFMFAKTRFAGNLYGTRTHCVVEDVPTDRNLEAGLGTISIKFHRVRVNGAFFESAGNGTHSEKVINERAKKALLTNSVG
jgi:hypothetical protein